jgi:hypothetical protein
MYETVSSYIFLFLRISSLEGMGVTEVYSKIEYDVMKIDLSGLKSISESEQHTVHQNEHFHAIKHSIQYRYICAQHKNVRLSVPISQVLSENISLSGGSVVLRKKLLLHRSEL